VSEASEQALRRAADLFHEIAAAIGSEDRLASCRNTIVAEKLRGNVRSREQLQRVAADGFELCVRALAALGAPDVTIHECGERQLAPWVDVSPTCTGTLVHDEYTPCPVHDQRDR
jgi:hypothetical protein